MLMENGLSICFYENGQISDICIYNNSEKWN